MPEFFLFRPNWLNSWAKVIIICHISKHRKFQLAEQRCKIQILDSILIKNRTLLKILLNLVRHLAHPFPLPNSSSKRIDQFFSLTPPQFSTFNIYLSRINLFGMGLSFKSQANITAFEKWELGKAFIPNNWGLLHRSFC
jgi:hypothetical protein